MLSHWLIFTIGLLKLIMESWGSNLCVKRKSVFTGYVAAFMVKMFWMLDVAKALCLFYWPGKELQ
ncbi:hypothetical protein P245_12330 [Comamonas thiooxydans]|uniref:Uncharacterized protein n=1 Tax=Comamonas thiooxydans TaxID=363952 RepID=A0A0E3BGT7_9BURK|nr:hypothetical protein P245_12330 [Comamonas thiooxydans]